MFPTLYTRFDECRPSGCSTTETEEASRDLDTLGLTDAHQLFPRHRCPRYSRLLLGMKHPLAHDMDLPNSVYRGLHGLRFDAQGRKLGKRRGKLTEEERRLLRYKARQDRILHMQYDDEPRWKAASKLPRAEIELDDGKGDEDEEEKAQDQVLVDAQVKKSGAGWKKLAGNLKSVLIMADDNFSSQAPHHHQTADDRKKSKKLKKSSKHGELDKLAATSIYNLKGSDSPAVRLLQQQKKGNKLSTTESGRTSRSRSTAVSFSETDDGNSDEASLFRVTAAYRNTGGGDGASSLSNRLTKSAQEIASAMLAPFGKERRAFSVSAGNRRLREFFDKNDVESFINKSKRSSSADDIFRLKRGSFGQGDDPFGLGLSGVLTKSAIARLRHKLLNGQDVLAPPNSRLSRSGLLSVGAARKKARWKLGLMEEDSTELDGTGRRGYKGKTVLSSIDEQNERKSTKLFLLPQKPMIKGGGSACTCVSHVLNGDKKTQLKPMRRKDASGVERSFFRLPSITEQLLFYYKNVDDRRPLEKQATSLDELPKLPTIEIC